MDVRRSQGAITFGHRSSTSFLSAFPSSLFSLAGIVGRDGRGCPTEPGCNNLLAIVHPPRSFLHSFLSFLWWGLWGGTGVDVRRSQGAITFWPSFISLVPFCISFLSLFFDGDCGEGRMCQRLQQKENIDVDGGGEEGSWKD